MSLKDHFQFPKGPFRLSPAARENRKEMPLDDIGGSTFSSVVVPARVRSCIQW